MGKIESRAGSRVTHLSDPTRVGKILDLVVEVLQTTQYVVSIFVFANLLTFS